MGKFSVERWRCDRCGAEHDRWLKPGSAYSIRASVDHGTAGGSILDWRELCSDCNSLVEQLVTGMARDVDLRREEMPHE
jgi:hypothetical protein